MQPDTELCNRLKAVRARLGLSQQDLALAAGVTRQTISGLETGLYAPSATVALRLARALGCPMEELFWLAGELPTIVATPLDAMPQQQSQRVALAQINGRWLARSLVGDAAFRTEMVPADGIATLGVTSSGLNVQLLDDANKLARTVVVGGCAPALSLWTRSAERWHPGLRINWTHLNSTAALQSLAREEIHIAGLHLSDPLTGRDNRAFAQQFIPDRAVVLINFGVWEEGLVTQPSNPQRLSQVADLARADIAIVNREIGAGARLLLDTLLQEADVPASAVKGYSHEVYSHQDIARTVLAGQADAGVSTAALAIAYGLSFVPLRQVRYDLAILQEHFQQAAIQQLLGTLDHRWVRSQLEVLGGYDTSRTSEIMD